MERFRDIRFPLLLAFALAVLPFDLSAAELRHAPEQHTAHTNMTMADSGMEQGCCVQDTTAKNCEAGTHSCQQCSTCSVTLLHDAVAIPFDTPATILHDPASSRLSQHSSLLFRPPRA